MHHLLEKLFAKQHIDDVTKLREDEKVQYDYYQKILSEGDITVDKIIAFCNAQIDSIEKAWANLDNLSQKNERLVLLHTVYKTLVTAITAPQKRREELERYLTDILNKLE